MNPPPRTTVEDAALETPGVRARLLRERRLGLLALIVGGLITMIALGGLVVVDHVYSDKQAAFRRYPGTVLSVRSDNSDDDSGTAAVSFDDAGRTRHARIHIDSTSDWRTGETVHVLVDPSDASFVTLRGENYRPDWFGGLALATCVLAAFPLVGLRRFRGAGKKLAALAATPWRTASGETRSAKDRSCVVYFERVEGGSFWRSSSRVRSRDGRIVAEIAGDRAHGLVLRPVGSRKLILARPINSVGPTRCRVLAYQVRRRALAIRVAGPTESTVYEIDESRSAEAFDEKRLDTVDTIDLSACPASWGALRIPGLEVTLIGVAVPDRRARRRFPALFEVEESVGRWKPDPSGRAQYRYWDGLGWTAHIADNGETDFDPCVPSPRSPVRADAE